MTCVLRLCLQGGDLLDMPGLSYVCAASELSLRTIMRGRVSGADSHNPADAIYHVVNDRLDRAVLLRGLSRMPSEVNDSGNQRGISTGRRKRDEPEEEEEDAGDE